jgi:TRAP-type C4-dicarboxylate transport system substrate-binding protein
MGGYQEPASINTRAAARFGEELERALADRVSFELVASVLKLGRKSGDLPDMVEHGELDACYISSVRFTGAVPELKVLELPYLVVDRVAAMKALEGELGARFREKFAAGTPFHLLGFWDNGFRHVTNKVHPIRTPADCKGLTIRTQMSELHAEALQAIGFKPIPVDVKEFAEQVTTDRFQAQENPLANTFSFGVHHYHRWITLTGHLFGASAFICNAAAYKSWDKAFRDAVDAAARAATRYQHELAAAEDAAVLQQLDPAQNEVITLTAGERAAFVQAVEPVLDRHRAELDPKLFDYFG